MVIACKHLNQHDCLHVTVVNIAQMKLKQADCEAVCHTMNESEVNQLVVPCQHVGVIYMQSLLLHAVASQVTDARFSLGSSQHAALDR